MLDGIPALAVLGQHARRLLQGQRVPFDELGVLLSEAQRFLQAEAVLVTQADVPLGLFRVENGVLKTIRMFNLDARS